jgi:hypothetical protein
MKNWKWEKYLSTLALITKANNALKIADRYRELIAGSCRPLRLLFISTCFISV